MKRVILVLVLALAMLMMTACGGETTPTTTAAASPSLSEMETSSNAEGSTQANSELEFTTVDDFELTKLDGTKVKLSEVSEKHTILNFWATWCTYCRKEMPHLAELAKRDDVAVIFVSQGETVDQVKAYMDEMGYDFDVYVDESRTYGSLFGLQGYPHNVFLTEGRGLMYQHPGYLEKDQIEDILKKIDEFREQNNI